MSRSVSLLAVVVLAAAAACTPKSKGSAKTTTSSPRPAATSKAKKPAPAASARSVLAQYLDATFAGRHARGWALLTHADQSRMSRSSYIGEQQDLARARSQMEALGKSKRRIGKVTEREDRAIATVVLTSGLGKELLRFVLRRERGGWRIDYASSWSPAN
jgi:hypothetical protein